MTRFVRAFGFDKKDGLNKMNRMTKPHFAVIECDRPKGLGCYRIAFTPDGCHVTGFASEMGRHKGRLRWNAQTGALEETIVEDFPSHAEGISPSDDAGQLAIQFRETVVIYDAASLIRLTEIPTLASVVGWGPSGDELVIARDNDASCWSLTTVTKTAEVCLHERQECDTIGLVGFLRDGDTVVLGRNSGIETWHPHTQQVERRVRFQPKDGRFWQHGLSPDRSVMLSLSDLGCLIQTDIQSWSSRRFTAVKNSYGSNFSFSHDGKLAACQTGLGTVFLWNVAEARLWLKWSKPHYSNLGALTFSSDGKRLACTLDFQVFVLDFRPGARSRSIHSLAPPAGKHRCVEMVGPDDQMDLRSGNMEPLNPLPQKCGHCRMPDLDFAVEPYQLGRGIEKPVDLAPAENGNFLVRDSVKRILEVVAPGECRFVSTIHYKTKTPTPWSLAVPQRMETTATPPKDRERCPSCGEPWCFHHYSESSESWRSPDATHEVFKARNWGSHKAAFISWDKDREEIFGRMLYFSIRLELLLKKLKVRGLVRSYGCRDLPTAEDMDWVKRQLTRLKARPADGKTDDQPEAGAPWFPDYLAKHAKPKTKPFDFAALEAKEKVKLPASYQAFAVRIGQKKFKNLNGDEGHDVVILPPQKLDFDTFRIPSEEDDGSPRRAVIFGAANSGDSLCFDVSTDNSDPEVLYHNHETDGFEPFATNFAQCIRQLAES
ncbi:hypothetical protein LBMAG56_24820 [Verrucomicrobiota bacterium]|nr:hypothetical protein LBMAG56_24820 [Verrucomicrobiota bacterium]